MTSITTHVLDLTSGRPAAGIPVVLERRDGPGSEWTPVQDALTDGDGRTADLPGRAGHEHRLVFDLADHLGPDAFFPRATIDFRAGDEDHLHVPLLLSRYGYSTYRGS